MASQKRSRQRSIIVSALLLVFVAALLGLAIMLVRVKLLQNAQNLGMSLAQSYAVEEENNLRMLEIQLGMAGQYVNEILADGGSPDEIQGWLSGYFSKLVSTIGEDLVDFYAVIDGMIVAVNPWEGDASFDYRSAQWYRDAIAAAGETVVGEAYQDSVTGEQIVTISQALEKDGSVLAMDVYIQNHALHPSSKSMPEDGSYFLCDGNGDILYAHSFWESSDADFQSHVQFLMSGIADGSLLAYGATFWDPSGVTRGAYYREMSNGWTVILTIPINSILMGEQNTIIYLMGAASLIAYLALIFLMVQEMIRNRKMRIADETIHILGDSFYAIYRINFRTGRYNVLKTHPTTAFLPASGSYDLLLQTVGSVVQPSTLRAFEASFSLESIRQRTSQGIADYGGDYQRRFGDTYRWVNIRTLYDQNVSPNEVIFCFRDVDEEKRRELQHTILLQDALSAAQKSTKAKSAFFSSMSHDMRTPLNAIIGFCDLAQKSCEAGSAEKTQSYLKKISFAGKQLLELINDILSLSRSEAGKVNLEERELDLAKLLNTLTDMFRDQVQTEGKTLELSVDLQHTMVMGDEKKITQIINNLLSNAIKYTNPGDSIRLEVHEFPFQPYSKYCFIVEDTGIGMSKGFLDNLFDPYSRETAFTSRSVTGTGLGMPIVKSLVQQMSGEISVESELGRGSRFTVVLPFKSLGNESAGTAEKAEESVSTFRWKGRRILIAEDNELNREILTAILEQFGAEVLQAQDGQAAVHLFAEQPPFSVDAILMDMQMPQMDGCQAASAIRGLDRRDAAVVPIVAVTANAFAEDINRTTAAGMNAHISKPIDSGVLRKTVERLILNAEAPPEPPADAG